MNYYGTVKLIDGGNTLHCFQYRSREERNQIVDRWKKTYGDTFYLYNVQVVPLVVLRVERKRVVTQKEKLLEKLQEESKERYQRPPARYDNLPTYNYDK